MRNERERTDGELGQIRGMKKSPMVSGSGKACAERETERSTECVFISCNLRQLCKCNLSLIFIFIVCTCAPVTV